MSTILPLNPPTVEDIVESIIAKLPVLEDRFQLKHSMVCRECSILFKTNDHTHTHCVVCREVERLNAIKPLKHDGHKNRPFARISRKERLAVFSKAQSAGTKVKDEHAERYLYWAVMRKLVGARNTHKHMRNIRLITAIEVIIFRRTFFVCALERMNPPRGQKAFVVCFLEDTTPDLRLVKTMYGRDFTYRGKIDV